MAVLSDADRIIIWQKLMAQAQCPNVLKTDFRAAVNAADDWVDTNAAAFNTTLPTAYKNSATAAQKAALIAAVTLKRYGRDF